MDRINNILKNDKFIYAIKKTNQAEEGRIYCLHGLEHAVDVARIGYILNLEYNYGILKDIIYASALLHDAGRYRQYMDNVPHQQASVELAEEILPQCGYTNEEIEDIKSAINTHRNEQVQNTLGEILRKADDISRLCFNCQARPTCKWSADEMNMEILY